MELFEFVLSRFQDWEGEVHLLLRLLISVLGWRAVFVRISALPLPSLMVFESLAKHYKKAFDEGCWVEDICLESRTVHQVIRLSLQGLIV